MSIYAIGDPHLSLGCDKEMNIFAGWHDYVQRLEQNWREWISSEDTVILAGDISWAMNIEDTLADFTFLHRLPGKKYLMKGNHDYWWNTKKKMDEFFFKNKFETLSVLHNNAYRVGDISICGTRGWFFDAESDLDKKVVKREAERLRRSIECGEKLGGEPVVFLHYPPINNLQICDTIYDVLVEKNIKRCYYAHLHSASVHNSFNGEKDGIHFQLLSADYLKFCPKLIEKIN